MSCCDARCGCVGEQRPLVLLSGNTAEMQRVCMCRLVILISSLPPPKFMKGSQVYVHLTPVVIVFFWLYYEACL